MADADVLALAYVASHPGDAARVLERLPTSEAAAFFSRLPARTVAPVLAAMSAHGGARVVGSVGDQVAASLLAAAGLHAAVGVLRHVPEPRRTRLIDALSTPVAAAARMLLGYPEDTAGAWADPRGLALAADTRVAEALDLVRGEAAGEATDVVVIDAQQRPVGMVDLGVLLRAPEWATLGGVMRALPASLRAATPVRSIAAHPAWRTHAALPVVGRGGRFIGVLRLAQLPHITASGARRAPAPGDATLAGFAARGYWGAVAGLVHAILFVLPAAKRVREDAP